MWEVQQHPWSSQMVHNDMVGEAVGFTFTD